jgi:hypothetical protein
MTIQEALNKAVDGGFHVNGADGADTDYSGANSEFSAWTRKDNDSSFIVPVEEMFLDPLFWQALGRALGWDHPISTVQEVDNGRLTMVTRTGQYWLSHWHCFLDFLAAGKTPEHFFAQFDA